MAKLLTINKTVEAIQYNGFNTDDIKKELIYFVVTRWERPDNYNIQSILTVTSPNLSCRKIIFENDWVVITKRNGTFHSYTIMTDKQFSELL